MQIENLIVGQTYRYQELCELLGEKVKSGKGKKYQLKEFQRYFTWEHPINKKGKTSKAFLITEIFDTPKPKLKQTRKYRPYCEKYEHFKVPHEHEDAMIVYRIVLNNTIYIGSTKKPKRRFLEHLTNKKGMSQKTSELLQQGATFEFIQAFNNEEVMRQFEKKLIKQYSTDSSWNCINIQIPKEPNSKPKLVSVKINFKDYNKTLELLKQHGIEFLV